jgi:Kef-type K+ transport system membrane component KefB
MLDNIWFIAAVWMGLALLASLISIRTGISVALIEIVVGVVVGNLAVGFEGGTLQVGMASANASAGHLHHILQSTEWTNFLALLGSGVLTFLAGAEIDPVSLKANWRVSVLIGVYMKVKEASYTTLLMATGLTFGTISALYGLQNGIIDQNQYTVLVSVVILSAFVPTLIAQKFFQPTIEMMHAWGRLYRRRLGRLSVEDVDTEVEGEVAKVG